MPSILLKEKIPLIDGWFRDVKHAKAIQFINQEKKENEQQSKVSGGGGGFQFLLGFYDPYLVEAKILFMLITIVELLFASVAAIDRKNNKRKNWGNF